MKFGPLNFKSKYYGDSSSPFVSSPLWKSVFCLSLHPWLPPHCEWPQSLSLQSHVFSLLPSSLWLFLPLVVEFCPSSGQFLGYLGWFDNYLDVVIGGGEPRVLLICHHPSSIFINICWTPIRDVVLMLHGTNRWVRHSSHCPLKAYNLRAPLAQSVERVTLDLRVVNLSPMLGSEIT